jgi:hypothetical protein
VDALQKCGLSAELVLALKFPVKVVNAAKKVHRSLSSVIHPDVWPDETANDLFHQITGAVTNLEDGELNDLLSALSLFKAMYDENTIFRITAKKTEESLKAALFRAESSAQVRDTKVTTDLALNSLSSGINGDLLHLLGKRFRGMAYEPDLNAVPLHDDEIQGQILPGYFKISHTKIHSAYWLYVNMKGELFKISYKQPPDVRWEGWKIIEEKQTTFLRSPDFIEKLDMGEPIASNYLNDCGFKISHLYHCNCVKLGTVIGLTNVHELMESPFMNNFAESDKMFLATITAHTVTKGKDYNGIFTDQSNDLLANFLSQVMKTHVAVRQVSQLRDGADKELLGGIENIPFLLYTTLDEQRVQCLATIPFGGIYK